MIEASSRDMAVTCDTVGMSELDAAAKICVDRNAQFTAMRRAVFATLVEAHQPLSAYQIMDRLRQSLARRMGPPTVYRALDFLMKHGLVARIESRNAFVAHVDSINAGAGAYLICDCCGSTAEIAADAIEALLLREAERLGFRIGKSVVELQGTCASCTGQPVPA